VVSSASFPLLLLAATGVLIVLFVALAFREARGLTVERETLHVANLPPALDGTTLVFLADIHAGPLLGAARMTRLVERVNELHADLVLLGGDYVGGKRRGADVFYPAAAGFSAKYGAYAVLGNHDWWEGVEEARRRMAEAGITLLDNSSARVAIGDAVLAIVGLSDEWTGTPDIAAATAGIELDDISVLVAHNPDSLAEALPRTPGTWALGLAGHTHGGQVAGVYHFNPHKPTRYGRRYLTRGLSEDNGVPIIVSYGVGAVTLPLRFMARPEIHLITVTR
jgi:predicted MPP superfamily phosphohydrolase